ncbi:MAG: hypothetical protein U0359_40885 [Byssovorax sp.]
MLGLSLGVRLSCFPYAIACTLIVARSEGATRAWLARARDLGAGIAIWLAPLILLAGARPLVAATLTQGLGHFGRWGGSALTVSSPSARLGGLASGLWPNLLAGPWPDAPAYRWPLAPILLVLLGAAIASIRPVFEACKRQPELAISMLAYVVWVMLGQNIASKPRHLLPLLPLLIIALAAGADALVQRARAAIALPALLAAIWAIDGTRLVSAHREPSPVAAAARFLAERTGRDARPVIAGDAARLYTEGAPGRTIRWAPDEAALIEAVLAAGPEGALISSEALTAGAAGPRIQDFRSPSPSSALAIGTSIRYGASSGWSRRARRFDEPFGKPGPATN